MVFVGENPMNIWMIWGSPVWRNLQMGYHMGYFRKFWDVLTEFVKKTTLKAWRFGDNKMFSDSKEIWRFFSQSFGASWYPPYESKHIQTLSFRRYGWIHRGRMFFQFQQSSQPSTGQADRPWRDERSYQTYGMDECRFSAG